MQIGNVTIEVPYILAPMAGVIDLPFRLLCKEQGGGAFMHGNDQRQGAAVSE